MGCKTSFLMSATLLMLATASTSPAVEIEKSEEGTNFGSPEAVENRIEEDAAPKGSFVERHLLESWFDWKGGLQDKHGIGLGMDYSTVFLGSDKKGLSGKDAASSGMFRFFGTWEIVGRGTPNTGTFVWKVESRHKYGSIPPFDFEFELGGVGIIEPPFSDQGGRVTNLYWHQRLNGGKITLVGGFLDATDYFDVFALASPWTGFLNFAFSTGTTTAFLPNDATLGFAAGAMLTEKIYVIAGLANAWSDSRVPFRGFETVGDGEYFKSVEIGWTPSHGRIYFDNAHVTYWNVDESGPAGTPGGWGMNFQYFRYLKETWMPFIRAGFADEGGSLMERSISAGFGYQSVGSKGLLGFAANWGKPNESSFGSGLKDQYTMELFYRFQLFEQLAITPDLQLLIDPPNNPDHAQIWVWGIRARLAL